MIDQATRELIDRLLLERISLAGIARAAQVSEQWLLSVRQREIRFGAPERSGGTQKKGRLTIQCDEMWSFAGNKGNKQWVWLALDADTREIVGVTIGTRDEASANKLWEFLLPPRSPMRDRIHGLLGSLWGSSTPANAIKQSVRKQALSSY